MSATGLLCAIWQGSSSPAFWGNPISMRRATTFPARPRSAKLANNLGYSYYLANDHDKAERYFRDAARYDPGYVHAWSNLALVYSRMGRYREARAAFDRIVDTHQAANNLGYLGMLQDDPVLARREFERATRLSPSYYRLANENLAAVADMSGRGARAVPPEAARARVGSGSVADHSVHP